MMKKVLITGSLAMLLILGLACASPHQLTDIVIGPDYQVSNFHSRGTFPPSIKRVAVLPISGGGKNFQTSQGREHLAEVLRSELDKLGRFEAIYLAHEEMKQWSGRETWTAEEVLPPGLLEKVRHETGADGLLFVNLSNYQAYPPLIVGWKMKLVDLQTKGPVWAIDEAFDAGEEAVANSARRFNKGRVQTNPVLADSRSVLLSPTLFARYSLQASLATLPPR